MREYTDKEILDLISCAKEVHDPPRKSMKVERGSQRNDMILRSLDDKLTFRVFMRINEHFPENFSIGLEFVPSDEPGSITLLRYNGPHGEHVTEPRHTTHHIHVAKADLVNSGMRAEREIRQANYGSYKDALWQFLKEINLTDAGKYFPQNPQAVLFAGEAQK